MPSERHVIETGRDDRTGCTCGWSTREPDWNLRHRDIHLHLAGAYERAAKVPRIGVPVELVA